MIINKLELENFRNYDHLTASFIPEINVFYGFNGQGKTNLLEAIYLCTCGRSHRTSRDADLIKFEQLHYQVLIEFIPQDEYCETLSIAYKKDNFSSARGKRIIKHDGIELTRIVDLMGIFHAVIFAPEDLQLLKDGPGIRRRFLDILISQIDKLYFIKLQQFVKIIQQRNKMLKDKNTNSKWQSLMDIWDFQLAELVTYIISKRIQVLNEISDMTKEFYQQISSGSEMIDLKYECTFKTNLKLEKEKVVQNIYDELQKKRQNDLYRGSTSLGPHHDDMQFFLNNKQAKLVASQGQTRSIVLALKLAELECLTEKTGIRPVLLLDDVMSELDQNRRNALIGAMKSAQVFVTCTEPDQVEEFSFSKNTDKSSIKYFNIDNGKFIK